MSAILPLDRRAFTAGLTLSAIAAPTILRAEPKTCRFSLDWTFSASSGFMLGAQKEGYFRDENIDVKISRGFGSGKVPVDIAAGLYDVGFGDFNSMAKFAAENLQAGVICVLMLYDGLPVAATALADGPIRKPADLEGRTIASPEGDAGRQLFPVFAEFAGFDASKVKWISVAPELRESLLARGQADAITGFLTSTMFGLRTIGIPQDRQVIMRYRDVGVPLYSNCIVTTRKYAEANPDMLKGLLRAITRGVRLLVTDPAKATLAVKEADPLVNLDLETERARVVVKEYIATDFAKQNGLSVVSMDRLRKSIDIMAKVYAFPRKPTPDELFTDAYLPPVSDRALV